MAFTQDQLNKLSEAIALGATTVKYGDKEVTYRSLSDMLKIKQQMETELSINPKLNRRKFVSYGRGYESESELY